MLSEQEHVSYRTQLLRKIHEQMEVDSKQILNGVCQTFEDYKRRSGRISAFMDVLAMDKNIVAAVTGLDYVENPTEWQ